MNKVMFIGRVANDVDYNEEKKYARFSLAVNEKTKDGEKVHYANHVAFGKTAEYVAKYVKKGVKLYLGSRFNQNQEKREQYSFIIEEIEFLSEKKDKEEFPFE